MRGGLGERLLTALLATVVILIAGTPGASRACDVCALHGSSVLDPPRRGFTAHVTEQFTSYNTYENAGGRSLPVNEWMQSSITSVVIGYGFASPWRVELNVPFINREYRRLHDQSIDRGHENGLGDAAVIGRFTAVDRVLSDQSLVRVELFAGLEFPTGDTSRLKEESEDEGAALATADVPVRPRHGGNTEPSGIHDQDLALGSGSVDALLGVNTFATYRRAFATAGFQYGVRGRGAHDYRYDNDFSFYLGLGGYVLVHSPLDLGLEARLAGETKGNDEQNGETLTGSNLTALYIGPQVHATHDERLRGALGVQIPVLQHVQELTLVADYRILASLSWQF